MTMLPICFYLHINDFRWKKLIFETFYRLDTKNNFIGILYKYWSHVLRQMNRLFDHNVYRHKSINILKLKDIHVFCASVYMYRALKNDEFPTLQNNLNARTAVHEHNTRTRENVQLPFPRVENIRINYIYQCQNIWNCLPQNIKSSPSLKIFKKNLHKHMIEMY